MFPFTFDTMIRNNVNFFNSFVNLKMVGYASYADALDTYTNGFFKRQIEDSKVLVNTIGDNMKKAASVGVK